jgi:eukaryotic-like serine/threonine-protein kinase
MRLLLTLGGRVVALTPGYRLDRYEIISLLGNGGMGEVYLAQDTRLDRKIALKLLPAQFTQDAVRVRRFVQEAKASSALNHPNILVIFEIGQTDSTHFIATEFIDGETLRARFKREPMGIDEVLDVAQQTASALTAAHTAGIVHRDIKPDNIMLRRDGIVKVLDFGLVKLTEDASIDLEGDTRALVMTDTGTVVGTAPYMSPEQARGLELDGRTDIWSLGVVMYEMIAGRAPFQGVTASHVIVSIIEQEQPSLGRFAPSAPPELQRIVRKALAKDRDNRYQTSRDLMIDLKNLRRDLDLQHEIEVSAAPGIRTSAATSSSDSPAATASRDSIGRSRADSEAAAAKEATVNSRSSAEYLTSEIRRQKKRASIALTLFVLSSVGLLYAVYRFGSGPKPVFTHFQNIAIKKLTTLGNVSDVVISPDGKYVVYDVTEGNRQGLWTKYLPTGSTVPIVPAAEVLGLGSTTFSPDGNFVYYILWDKNNPNGSLFMVPVLGGNAKKVLENIRSSISFSPDGKRFVFVRILDSSATALFIANTDGANERQLAALSGSDRFSVNGPSWSPDGKLIACATGTTTGSQRMTISVASVDNGAIKALTSQQWSGVNRVAWFPDGSGIVFLAAPLMTTDRQIWQLSYPSGEVRRITNDLNSYGDASLGVTSDGSTVVSMQVTRGSDIWIAPSNAVDAQARQITMRNQRQNGARGMSWTPDGRIVYSSNASDNADIWSMNADGSDQKQLTDDPQADVNPVVSPDGRYVVFQSLRAGNWNIWRMQSDGYNLKQLTSGDNDVDPDVTPDGQWVIYCARENANTTIWKMPIEGGAPVRLSVATQATNPSVSPDGKQVAYIEVASNSKAPYKLILISIEGGTPLKTFDIPVLASDLRWTPDGRALVYLGRGAFAGVASIWRQSLDGTAPIAIVEFKPDSIYAFAYSRDGRQLALSRGSLTRDAVLISDSK